MRPGSTFGAATSPCCRCHRVPGTTPGPRTTRSGAAHPPAPAPCRWSATTGPGCSRSLDGSSSRMSNRRPSRVSRSAPSRRGTVPRLRPSRSSKSASGDPPSCPSISSCWRPIGASPRAPRARSAATSAATPSLRSTRHGPAAPGGAAAHPRPARQGGALSAPVARRGGPTPGPCFDPQELPGDRRRAPGPGAREHRPRQAHPGRGPGVPQPQAGVWPVSSPRPVHPRRPAPRARDRGALGPGQPQRGQARRPTPGPPPRDHTPDPRAGPSAHRDLHRGPLPGALDHGARHRACARASSSPCAGRTSTSRPGACGSATRWRTWLGR